MSNVYPADEGNLDPALEDWHEAIAALEQALQMSGRQSGAELYIAELALGRLRDQLSERVEQAGAAPDAAGSQALERVRQALSLIAGMRSPATAAQRQQIEQARERLQAIDPVGLRPRGQAQVQPEAHASTARIYESGGGEALTAAPAIPPPAGALPDPGVDPVRPDARPRRRPPSQVFHPAFNTIARGSIIGGVLLLTLLLMSAAKINTSPYISGVNVTVQQPVPFSHQHHVAGLGISCQYCHGSVATSSFAGIPPTQTCMTCHSQIWNQAPMLQPVRDSYRTGQPIQWNRVNDLADFVYFNHSIHVNKGVGCQTCHGQVDQMPLMRKAQPMNMAWCLSCHNGPEKFLRPLDQIYNMQYVAPANQLELGRQLMKQYGINKTRLTNCSICHR